MQRKGLQSPQYCELPMETVTVLSYRPCTLKEFLSKTFIPFCEPVRLELSDPLKLLLLILVLGEEVGEMLLGCSSARFGVVEDLVMSVGSSSAGE